MAISDLLENNLFKPKGAAGGPYRLALSVKENRLVFDIAREERPARGAHSAVAGAVSPHHQGLFPGLRQLLQGDPHRAAVPDRSARYGPARRPRRRHRTSEKRLDGKIETDFDTARRLFTLICVLHLKG